MGPRVALDGLLEVPNIALDGRRGSLCRCHTGIYINVNLKRDRDNSFMINNEFLAN